MASEGGGRATSGAPAGVLAHAAWLWRGNGAAFWRIVVPAVLALEACYALIDLALVPGGSFVRDGTLYVVGASTVPYDAAQAAQLAVTFLVVLQIVNGALLRIYTNADGGRATAPGDAVRYAARHFPGLVVIAVAFALMVMLSSSLFFLPGVYLYVAFAVALPVYVVEGRTAFDAFGRSHALVRRHWWATARVMAIVLAAALAVGFGVPALLRTLEHGARPLGTTAFVLLARGADALGWILVMPLAAAVTTALYFELSGRELRAADPGEAHATLTAELPGAG